MDKFICMECGRDFGSLMSLGVHIVRGHKIKTEDYYLKYINPEKGKCVECGKGATFIGLGNGYLKYCSRKCSNNSNEMKDKTKETCMKKYGCENPSQNREIKNKKKETCVKKYGCENPMQNIKLKNKHKETCMKKFGCENPSQSEEIKNKRKETCMKNFGCEFPMQNDEIKNKHKEACYKNFGHEHPLQNDEIKNKYKATCKKNFGFEHPLQNDEIKNKQRQTCIKNFGFENPMQNPEFSKKVGIKSRLNFDKIQERYPDLVKIEELISGPNGEILGPCKNLNCINSKENGGYFELNWNQIYNRNLGINSTSDANYFYCCEECKQECPLYRRSAVAINNLTSENIDSPYSSQEYLTFRTEVLKRQLQENKDHLENFCEKCHSTENLIIHHIQPQKLEPGYALDPPNGIVLCQKCHFEIGHKTGTECSTGNLANKLCK